MSESLIRSAAREDERLPGEDSLTCEDAPVDSVYPFRDIDFHEVSSIA